MPELVDGEIVQAVKEDPEAGTELLFTCCRQFVVRALERRYSYCDHHLIEEAANDTAIHAAMTFDTARGVPLGGWWTYLAGHRLCDILRGQPRRCVDITSLEVDARSNDLPTQEDVSDEISAEIRCALDILTPQERDIILADIDTGQSAKAAVLAASLGTSVNAIYSARSRARKKLLTRLGHLL